MSGKQESANTNIFAKRAMDAAVNVLGINQDQITSDVSKLARPTIASFMAIIFAEIQQMAFEMEHPSISMHREIAICRDVVVIFAHKDNAGDVLDSEDIEFVEAMFSSFLLIAENLANHMMIK